MARIWRTGPVPAPAGLRPIGDQCARLAAARDAADRSGVPFVLNAARELLDGEAGALRDALPVAELQAAMP